MLLTLLIPRRWVASAYQVLLLAGAALWLDTAVGLAQMRLAAGQPWLRLVLILGGVALATAASGLLFCTRPLRQRYRVEGTTAVPSTAAFLLTLSVLAVVQLRVERPMLLLERFLPGSGWVEALALATYAAFVTEKMLVLRQSAPWRRRIWGLFSIAFFAQLATGLAGAERFLMSGKLHLPVPALILAGPLFRGEGLFMLVLFAVTVVLVGPAWCSHLCYIGAWDSAAAHRLRRPQPLPRWRHGARAAVLVLVVGAALGLRWAGVPGTVAAALAAAFGLGGVAVMLLWSRRRGAMAHCVTYCPMGLVAVLLGRISPFRLRVHSDCDACGACALACRYGALGPEDIRRHRPGQACTLCGDCLGRCRSLCLQYRCAGLGPEAARALFLVLVVSAHAAFLGVARL
jgi:ferredoxin